MLLPASRPRAQAPHPFGAAHSFNVFDEGCYVGGCGRREGDAVLALAVLAFDQLEDGKPVSVKTPDFGDADVGEDGKLVERRAGDINLDHYVGRRGGGEVYARPGAHAGAV